MLEKNCCDKICDKICESKEFNFRSKNVVNSDSVDFGIGYSNFNTNPESYMKMRNISFEQYLKERDDAVLNLINLLKIDDYTIIYGVNGLALSLGSSVSIDGTINGEPTEVFALYRPFINKCPHKIKFSDFDCIEKNDDIYLVEIQFLLLSQNINELTPYWSQGYMQIYDGYDKCLKKEFKYAYDSFLYFTPTMESTSTTEPDSVEQKIALSGCGMATVKFSPNNKYVGKFSFNIFNQYVSKISADQLNSVVIEKSIGEYNLSGCVVKEICKESRNMWMRPNHRNTRNMTRNTTYTFTLEQILEKIYTKKIFDIISKNVTNENNDSNTDSNTNPN